MKLNREQRVLTRAFRNTFDTPDGEVVLKYLMEEYGCAPISDENSIKMACGVGARNLVMDILSIMERGDSDEIYDEIPG